MSLRDGTKLQLLRLARNAVSAAAGGDRFVPDPLSESDAVRPAGAFVTLRRGVNLRGCIGTFESSEPLYLTVAKMARAATTGDPRFEPTRPAEVSELEIEISVLTPMRRLRDPDEVEVGRHGLYIVRGYHRGVLLPQVAVEYGWSREEFLENTCRKASLPPDAWRHGAEIYVFEAEVFGEEDMLGAES